MSGIKLTGDFKKFDQRLQRMTRMNFTALHKEIGEYMVTSTKENFKRGQTPGGKPWPKSRRARAQGGQTLVDTKRLANSITYRATPQRVDIGTNVKYASVHQEGKAIKARGDGYMRFKVAGKWAMKKRVKIPARRFLGISGRDGTEIKHIIQDRIEGALR